MWRRASGRVPVAGVQEQLPLDDVVGEVVLLRSGAARAVLEASSVNFALRSEAEQEAILAGYRRFLNALDYPLQLLVRVVIADVERYLAGLSGAGAGSEQLLRLARDHRAFVRRIARERTLLGRRFFVVIPAEREGGPAGAAARGTARRLLPRRGGPSPARRRSDVDHTWRTLSFRAGEVMRGLGSFGVETRRLGGDELRALWRETLAPGSAWREEPAAPGRSGPEPPGLRDRVPAARGRDRGPRDRGHDRGRARFRRAVRGRLHPADDPGRAAAPPAQGRMRCRRSPRGGPPRTGRSARRCAPC